MHTGTGEVPLSAKGNTQDSNAVGPRATGSTALQRFSNTAGLCSQGSSASKPTCPQFWHVCYSVESWHTFTFWVYGSISSVAEVWRMSCICRKGPKQYFRGRAGPCLFLHLHQVSLQTRSRFASQAVRQGNQGTSCQRWSQLPHRPLLPHCSYTPQQGLLQAQPPAAGHISTALLPLDCYFPASSPSTSPVLDTALSESSCWSSFLGENQNGPWMKASQKGRICIILTLTFLTVTLQLWNNFFHVEREITHHCPLPC